jgi:hypothetical protein
MEQSDSSTLIIIKIINTSEHPIYVSSSLNYGGSFVSDSSALLDASYLETGYDWLLIPKLELEYTKLDTNEYLILQKNKKSISIQEISIRVDVLEHFEQLPYRIKRDISDSKLMTKNIFLESISKHWKVIEINFSKKGVDKYIKEVRW